MSLGIVKTWDEQFPDYPQDDVQWGIIPAHMRHGVYEYVMHGRPVGSFLTSVISDQPISTVWAKADQTNRDQMNGWMIFLYNYFPSKARGSAEAMQAWIDKGGIIGKESEQ
jgi:hypothetical protein